MLEPKVRVFDFLIHMPFVFSLLLHPLAFLVCFCESEEMAALESRIWLSTKHLISPP